MSTQQSLLSRSSTVYAWRTTLLSGITIIVSLTLCALNLELLVGMKSEGKNESSDLVFLSTSHSPHFSDSSTPPLFLLYCCDLNIYSQTRIAESGLKTTQTYPSAPEPTNRNQNLYSLEIHALKLCPEFSNISSQPFSS